MDAPNTRPVVQVMLADLAERWRETLAKKSVEPEPSPRPNVLGAEAVAPTDPDVKTGLDTSRVHGAAPGKGIEPGEMDKRKPCTNSQYGIRELQEVLKNKKTDEIFAMLAELSISTLPNSVENCCWFLEHYVLAHISKESIKKHYALLAEVAAACADSATAHVVEVH
jgi:hypothetical protein